MSQWEVRNKKNGRVSILDDEELAKLKELKINQRYEIVEIKPIRQIQSPFVVKIEKVDKTTKNKK